jgi:hypothetical protein
VRHNLLFRTPAGSRLYGLENEDSDYDWYSVVERVPKKRLTFTTHSIVGDQDNTVVDFGTWVNACQAGVPQALEAMFSTKAKVDRIAEYRAGFKAGTDYSKYLGTMKKMSHEHPDSFKHKRHILRLALNMKGLRERNRFDPTLDRVQIALINGLAKLDMENVYNDALALAWS